MLAMYVYLQKYMNDAPPHVLDTCLSNWVERNKKWLDPGVSARDVRKKGERFMRKISKLGLTLDDVEDEIDWALMDPSGENADDDLRTDDEDDSSASGRDE